MKRVIRFTASWCQPCKSLSKTLESINSNVPIETYDIDDNPDYAFEYGIRSVPTMIMLDGNSEVKRFSGVKTKDQIEDWLS